jgi:hypothetical protein
MPRFFEQIPSQTSAEKVKSSIGNFLAARGFKLKNKKEGNEWWKGFYWVQNVKYQYAQGRIQLEVWNYCPYPGLGSLLIYFVGIGELKQLLQDLVEMLSREDPSQDTASAPTAEEFAKAESQSPSLPETPKKTVVGFAKAWIIFWIIGNAAAICAPMYMLSNPSTSGIALTVMILSAAVAAGYVMLYNKNPFGLYLVLVANLLALAMNSPYTLVKTGLIPGLLTFFITYKQIAYPFGRSKTIQANPPPTASDYPVAAQQQITAHEAEPSVKHAPPTNAESLAKYTPLRESETPTPSEETNPITPKNSKSNSSSKILWGGGALIAICLVLACCGGVSVPLATAYFAQASSSAPRSVDLSALQPQPSETPMMASTPIDTRPEFITPTNEDEAATQPLPAAITATAMIPLPTAGHSIKVHAAQSKILDVAGWFVLWSPNGKWLILGERQIHFYDAHTLQEVRYVQADRWVEGMAISPDSKTLAAIDESRGVMLFDVESGSELRTLTRARIDASPPTYSYLAFSPDSALLAVVVGEVVKLYRVADGEEIGTLVTRRANAIAFTPDGKGLYAGSWENGITLFDIASGKSILEFGDKSRGASLLILSQAGDVLVSAGASSGTMTLWEAATGRLLRSFEGHNDSITSMVFSPDGRMLASASRDMTIRLWDVATGKELQSLVGHTEAPKSIAISPDGGILASGSEDGTTRLWTLTRNGI